MICGEFIQIKVYYKVGGEDFIIFVDDVDVYKKFCDGDIIVVMVYFMFNMIIYFIYK